MLEELITEMFIRVSPILGPDETAVRQWVANYVAMTPDEVKVAIEKTRRNG
jgi:hypothetical protein